MNLPIYSGLEQDDRALPTVSLVMPSFNQGKYIEAAIRSVVLQAYPRLQLIIMDGGSTDESVEIIDRYAHHIFYRCSERDGGQAHALSKGFAMAEGDIQCWLNSDDVLLPGALNHVGRFFTSHPHVDFLYGNRKVIDASGVVTEAHVWPWLLTSQHWARGQYLAQECCFWRRDLYARAGGVDPRKQFIMDYDLFYRMWRVGRFRKTPRFLGCIRMHAESKNSTMQHVRERELAAALEAYGVRRPGRTTMGLMNRVDALTTKVERWLNRASG